MTYQVFIAPSALKMLQDILDRRIREKIRDRIDGLIKDPEKQGKTLTGELTGFRSLRVGGQHYRIVYQVEKSKVTVFVVGVGTRKEGSRADIYALAKKLVRLGLAKPPHK